MPARTPEEVARLFAEAFSAHDLEALMALYEPESPIVRPEYVCGPPAASQSISVT